MKLNKRQRVIERYKGICQRCSIQTNTTDRKRYPELDHIIPRSFGGDNSEANLSLLCNQCNNIRSNAYGLVLLEKIESGIEDVFSENSLDSISYEMKSGILNSDQLEIFKERLEKLFKMYSKELSLIQRKGAEK